MRILLLEDNNVTRTVVCGALEKHGWEVLSFPEPSACPLCHITRCSCPLSEECADVIVTDFNMPGMDGCSFVEQLIQKGCRVKSIALLSDASDSAVIEHASTLGLVVFKKADHMDALLNWLEETNEVTRAKRLTCEAAATRLTTPGASALTKCGRRRACW